MKSGLVVVMLVVFLAAALLPAVAQEKRTETRTWTANSDDLVGTDDVLNRGFTMVEKEGVYLKWVD